MSVNNVSVDGTFRPSAWHLYQIFILCVEYRGKFIPVALGWLPDKKPISYFTFIVLVLLAFKEKENEILEMYGKSELKLRKIKCDYEVAIHKGLDMFTLSGCYFHFSQAIWRKVMMSGLYVAYMQDKQFNRFVRMVMALAFLPINRLEPALDRLREYSFSLTPATPPPATRKSRFSKRKYI